MKLKRIKPGHYRVVTAPTVVDIKRDKPEHEWRILVDGERWDGHRSLTFCRRLIEQRFGL